ncbi:MAG: ribosome-associated translation inhibitor RaiA [Actinomycetaceae bacterium]|nr:ribosome-associated translation inhibitor RaiA [Arcanobacterium sp.]MDD7687670.1 ribosome-associated translation inhibitor RaiA [Actinomycetaceae bacterium]MDY5273939.1 ribosome-associated translation inhibitor RaiA [Arcanobacterium sp.]
MEFVVKGRNAEISDRFRNHVEEKLEKIEQFAPRAQRVDVELTHEPNPAQVERAERIEITVRDKGPVIRAEASSADQYSALDLAIQKLFEQLRRAHERKKDRRRRRGVEPTPEELNVDALLASIHFDDTDQAEGNSDAASLKAPTKPGETVETQLGDSPVLVRQKLYEAKPMTVDQALYEMELVGHAFYLFIDEETKQPCVAYRRHGWTYGVIRLNAVTGDFGPAAE